MYYYIFHKGGRVRKKLLILVISVLQYMLNSLTMVVVIGSICLEMIFTMTMGTDLFMIMRMINDIITFG
jgi:geranylgeranyl pyrophosphate synthase